MIRPARTGFFISAAPSPLLTIFGIGQPMLMSMAAGERVQGVSGAESVFAAYAMTDGSEPKICTAQGISSSAMRARTAVFLSWYHKAFAEIISVVVYSAPKLRQTARNAASVTPAIGASISPCARTAVQLSAILPIRIA